LLKPARQVGYPVLTPCDECVSDWAAVIPGSQRTLHAKTARGESRHGCRPDRPVEHGSSHCCTCGLCQSSGEVGGQALGVALQRLVEEVFFAAERPVQAGAADPHRLGEVVKTGALVAL